MRKNEATLGVPRCLSDCVPHSTSHWLNHIITKILFNKTVMRGVFFSSKYTRDMTWWPGSVESVPPDLLAGIKRWAPGGEGRRYGMVY